MKTQHQVANNIYRATMPYKDIMTSVFLVNTEQGALLFDTGSFDTDAEKYIVPFFDDMGIAADAIKYVFISHEHTDHAGGLRGFAKLFPGVKIITCSAQLKLDLPEYDINVLNDGDMVLGVLKIIKIQGHTCDCAGVFDTRTKTLLSGDCLQGYGIFGSGTWGANVRFPREHIESVTKLKQTDIESIIAAHDYHPYGYRYDGRREIEKALDTCLEPIYEIKELISKKTGLCDEEIAALYNNPAKPTLGAHIVSAVRKSGICN